jgi:hypothetical protein
MNFAIMNPTNIFPRKDELQNKLWGRKVTRVPVSNIPTLGAQVFQDKITCIKGIMPPANLTPQQVTALCSELGKVNTIKHNLRRCIHP